MKYSLLLAVLLTACGDTGCGETETLTRITDASGTYWQRCWEFQCPGHIKERRCRKE